MTYEPNLISGNPTLSEEPPPGDNDSSVASTGWVQTELSSYLTTTTASTTYAPIASPALTGDPTAPTPAGGDNDTSIATTAFVQGELGSYAPIASPALTGNPTAPTAAPGDNDTTIATTAFVAAAVSTAIDGADQLSEMTDVDLTGLADGMVLQYDGVTDNRWEAIAPPWAPTASPAFTGDPTAPSPALGDSDTSIATTAWVQGELGDFAPIASPVFTGNPTAPTPPAADNDTSIATTAWVQGEIAAISDTKSATLKTAAYTLLNSDDVVIGDTTSSSFTFTMPATPTDGKCWNIKKQVSANQLTVDGNGKNIDGDPTVVLGSATKESIQICYFASVGGYVLI